MVIPLPLTSDYLEDMGEWALRAEDRLDIAAELVAAVADGAVINPLDSGAALGLASEIHEAEGDLDSALALAEQSAAMPGRTDFRFAWLAELQFRTGREEEAVAQVDALRPLLVQDPDAAYYIAEALEVMGRRNQAHEWLTEALVPALALGQTMDEDDDDIVRATGVVFSLLQVRHRVRGELGLPHDDNDELADELRGELDRLNHPGPILFWPSDDFDRLLAQWPGQDEVWGADWDTHRTEIEEELQAWSDTGTHDLSLLAGSFTDLIAFAAGEQADPSGEEVQLDYADSLPEQSGIAWPPPRNARCWCGSGAKYKKCCLPRPR